MRNITAIAIFVILVCLVGFATYCHLRFGQIDTIGVFIVTALAALGTCGVTILSVFPYQHKDKLDAVLCKRKKTMYIMIYSKCNHTVYLGSDKYHTAKYFDAYALWWPKKQKQTELNSRQLYVRPGDNMAVPPRSTIGYVINPKVFGKRNLDDVVIQVMTSNGYRIPVRNILKQQETAKSNKNK